MERAVSATYTVLFTDLVDSTAQRARVGDIAADDLRRRHDALLTTQVEAHHGEVIKSTGDGIMAAFLGAADGIACAVAVQQAIHEWNESNLEHFDVRIGVSLGDARLEDGDLFGTPVVEAARLCARAEGGEILCADVVRVVAGSRATQRFTSVGALALKGLPEPLPTVRVEWEPRAAVEGGLPFPRGLEPTGRFPFVGRHPELDTLMSLWSGAVDGASSLVLVSGEPGIGKTRISCELARRVHTQGLTVLYGRCDDELGVPYQPFVEALAFVIDNFEPKDFVQVVGRHAAELTRLVPRLAEHVPDLAPPVSTDPETSQYRLFEAVTGTLVAASNLQPILFVIDDLHWAAKPTLLLLRHIASSPAAARMMIVGTYRDSDLYRSQPLAAILGDLRRIDGVERIALTGLDGPEVAEFMSRVAGHELDEAGIALAQMIYDETDGNPLFTGEVLRHLQEVGAIYEVDGRWTTRDVTEVGIPDGVREVIGRRLNRLAPVTNEVLQIGAVVGRSFDLVVVQRLVDVDRDDLLTALDEAVEARVVTEVAIGHYTFSHALMRSALYDELRPTRRARLHERVAEAVSTVYADAIETHLGELAYHYARSIGTGDVNKAIEYSQRAGDRALAQLAFDDAVSWFQQARDLIEDGAGDRAQLAHVLMGLGVAQKYAGVPVFRDTLLDAAAQAEKDGDAAVLAAAALANTRGFWSGYGDIDSALADVFRTAIGGLTPEMQSERARLLANLAVETVFDGTLDSRRELVDEALAIAREIDDDATLAHVLVSRSVALWDMSTLNERLDHGRELTGLTAAIGDPHLEYFASWYRMAALVEAGRIREADAVHAVCSDLARNLGRGIPMWSDAFTRAGCALLAGDWDRAEALASEQYEIGDRLGHGDALLFYGVLLFSIRFEQGRLPEIADLVRAVGTGDVVPDGVDALWGITACVLGDDDEAARVLDGLAAPGFTNLPRHQSWSSTLWAASLIAAHLGDTARAEQLYDLFTACPARLVYPGLNVFDSVPSTLGLLALTLGRHDVAHAHFDDAEELEASIPAPNLLARTRARRRGPPTSRRLMRSLTSDYLVIGAGAMGMAFTDALVDHADVHVTLVDRRHAAGGHWQDAYPFVQLHQASLFYGVASTLLGTGAVQPNGPEAGLHERARQAEIQAYYDDVLHRRLLGSGRVTFLGGCEYHADGDTHLVTSRVSGETVEVRVRRRIVDATYLAPTVPATTPPPFAVDDDVEVVPINQLARLDSAPGAFVVVGSGKTATDGIVWLLRNGVAPDDIVWVRPRDPWMLNRAVVQPDPVVALGLAADTMAAAAGAESLEDFFLRLEASGVMLRIDDRVTPTMAKAPTLGTWELELLRSVEQVVRLGHIRHVTRREIVLDRGSVPLPPGSLVVHCAASGLRYPPMVPIWAPDRIRVQTIRAGFPCFNAALAGYVEATRDDDRERNRLCPPNTLPDNLTNWTQMQVRGTLATRAFGAEPDIAAWANACALNPARIDPAQRDEPAVREAIARLAREADRGLTRMGELASEPLGRGGQPSEERS